MAPQDEPADDLVIILPDKEVNLADEKEEFKVWLGENRRRNHLRAFVFLRRNQPATATEVAKRLQTYYRRPISAPDIHYLFRQLMGWGVITQVKVSDILNKANRTVIENKIIGNFRQFLEKIPLSIQSRFIHTNYYYVNSYGNEFVGWASQAIGAKIKKKEVEKEVENGGV